MTKRYKDFIKNYKSYEQEKFRLREHTGRFEFITKIRLFFGTINDSI